uniref:MYB protein n=1 Tax=Zingiber officinale TaxID=94328 RepID=A0AA50CAE5_ZINOF|nr:MYB protein [Zingiber officinale]
MVTENDPTPVAPAVVAPAKKDWHEDDLLREHIALHGIDSWTSLSALFKDKSSRQCRRRMQKGGWSAEEDMILCEAQKMFGNRWMEIAKVVSGRTDNAVNSFSVLCKKRAKIEVSSKENRVPSLYPSTKRVLVGEPSTSNEQMRYHISPLKNTSGAHRTSLGEHGPAQHLQRSLLLAVQVFDTANRSLSDMGVYQYDASNKVSQVTFLRKDDQKLTALLQQSELLTSLSKKVNAENNNQSFDEAWKERHFLHSLIDLPTPANDNNSKIPSCKRALRDIFKPS